MIYILVIVVCLLTFYMLRDSYGWGVVLQALSVIVIAGTLVTSCVNSDTYQAAERADALKAAQDAQPRVIREYDGCKVYTFKAGDRWHYYTKCPSTTTTESSYKVSCGKNCSKTEVETIVTENK